MVFSTGGEEYSSCYTNATTVPRHLSPKQYGEDVIDSGQHAVFSMCSAVLHGERLFRISLIDERDGASGEKGESSQTN